MGFRFWRRVGVAPGVTLNLSKSFPSISFGRRGARLTVGPRGVRGTIGIPGSGLFYTTPLRRPRPRSRPGPRGRSAGPRVGSKETQPSPIDPSFFDAEPPRLDFLERLVTPAEEEDFLDACRILARGERERAQDRLRAAAIDLPDAAYLAGLLALEAGRLDEAVDALERARKGVARGREGRKGALGSLFARYGFFPTLMIPITDEVAARITPDRRGVLLALVEVYQRKGWLEKAVDCLEELFRTAPDDPAVRLSLAELLWETGRVSREPGRMERSAAAVGGSSGITGAETRDGDGDARIAKRVLELTEGAAGGTPVEAGLLLYRARALVVLGCLVAARDLLSRALRRHRRYPAPLVRTLRYERALVYERLGHRRRARRELEAIFAEDPAFEDVAARLDLE